MASVNDTTMMLGPFCGRISPGWDRPAVRELLAGLDGLLAGAEGIDGGRHALGDSSAGALPSRAEGMAGGRNQLIRLTPRLEGGEVALMVKAFGGGGLWREVSRWSKGSKARRSWEVARRLVEGGVGTPEPVAYLERREARSGGAPMYYVSRYVPELVSFRDELIRLFREDPECWKIMELERCVAEAIRAMHAAGVQHRDLGNQNILMRREGDAAWRDLQFVDLNRARLLPALSLRQRARDLSRIHLPSDLLRVFLEMYCADVPPPAFLAWERRYRRRYALHAGTRAWRHPLRERRRMGLEAEAGTYPAPRDLWIWDERSVQAISTLTTRDRVNYYPRFRHARVAVDALTLAPAVWRAYRELLADCFAGRVAMAGRVGVAMEPLEGRLERELALVRELGNPPLMVRLYQHESEARLRERLQGIRTLSGLGLSVYAALVQDRRAVTEPGRWRRFVEVCLAGSAGCVEGVEIGHAINRVKWGIWTMGEWRGLMEAVRDVAAGYPGLRLSGPAVIDFEYPFVASALRQLPPGLNLAALSHHLYVDRRGAPENPQGRFATVEKCALARALARVSPQCEDRLIISEVNWPIAGTGLYSPVNSPYASPGPRTGDPSVSEAQYADYMIRYLLSALCSGMVERVYWWRLVARGFGLVDEGGDGVWRSRPAFAALRYFLATVGPSTFLKREVRRAASGDALWRLHFRTATGGALLVTFARGGVHPVEDAGVSITDLEGRVVASDVARVTGSPLYLHGGVAG